MNQQKEEDSPEKRVLAVIEIKLQTSRDRLERDVLKSILLSAGIISLTNNSNKDFAVREK